MGQGIQGSELPWPHLAAEPPATARCVHPAGLPQLEGTGLAAATARLMGRLWASGGHRRAQRQLLLRARGTVQRLEGGPGGEAGAEEQQPAAADQSPSAGHGGVELGPLDRKSVV